jgi:hypothetical protein
VHAVAVEVVAEAADSGEGAQASPAADRPAEAPLVVAVGPRVGEAAADTNARAAARVSNGRAVAKVTNARVTDRVGSEMVIAAPGSAAGLSGRRVGLGNVLTVLTVLTALIVPKIPTGLRIPTVIPVMTTPTVTNIGTIETSSMRIVGITTSGRLSPPRRTGP